MIGFDADACEIPAWTRYSLATYRANEKLSFNIAEQWCVVRGVGEVLDGKWPISGMGRASWVFFRCGAVSGGLGSWRERGRRWVKELEYGIPHG